jgi:Rrf2 family nitric oxide-sensitive transcriptional repressor
VRGKTGGITLAKEPTSIRIGEVIRLTEAHFNLVECFDAHAQHCCTVPVCALRRLLQNGLEQFFALLDQHTLADLLQRSDDYLAVLPSRASQFRPLPEPGEP